MTTTQTVPDASAQADPGLWRQVLHDIATDAPQPALFLDRDGVIVEEVNYLHKPSDVRLIDGAGAAIRAANDAGLAVVMVTNQSGVGRGYYGWEDFTAVQERLLALLGAEDARVDIVLACAYHRDALPPYDVADHPWRKPNPGMLLAAAEALTLDLGKSWIVGDTAGDLAAGAAAGLAGGVHVLTGHGARERAAARGLKSPNFEMRAVMGIADLRSPPHN